ncbi:MAG: limonene-1,2-epoxide hydrolase family protein [Parvibaculum sp.]
MLENEKYIRDFIEAWSRLDVDELVGFFAADGVYHNMPITPVAGTADLKNFIGAFLANWTATNWDVLTLISSGDIVIAERVDHINVSGIHIDLPCCGVFEIENGKIKVWRDYFDMATFTGPLTPK